MPSRRASRAQRLNPSQAARDIVTAYVPMTSMDWDDRFSKALIFSIIAHIVFMFGVYFKPVNPKLLQNDTPPLEVVLVNARSQQKPLKADVLAQANLEGGGQVEEDRQASSPLPASSEDRPLSAEKQLQQKVQALEQEAEILLRQIESKYAVPEVPPAPPREPAPPVPETPPAPTDLALRSLEMARLQARIEQQWDEYQKRPRRLSVGARAKEYSAARYVEDWRIKVERIGNLNYPEAARRAGMHGSLVLTVSIRADGSIESVQIVRPSGSRILDAAALKIVELAAPYGPFSEEMRKKWDVLDISRTWAFTRSDQFASQ